MSRTLRLPSDLRESHFVVAWERDEEVFLLCLPDGSTYEIGDWFEAEAYFKRSLWGVDPFWVQRIVEVAKSLYACQVDPVSKMIVQIDFNPDRSKVERNMLWGEPEPSAEGCLF